MGKGKRKSARRSQETDDDVIDLHDEGEIEPSLADGVDRTLNGWLTNQIEADAHTKLKRGQKGTVYGAVDMCVVGLERILSMTQEDDFEQLPLTAVESQLTLAKMYQSRAFEHIISTTDSVDAKSMVQRKQMMDRVGGLYNHLVALLDGRIKAIERQRVIDRVDLQRPTTVMHNSVPELKVKKIEIEKFDGNEEKWTQFKTCFEDCFHNRSDMTGSTKFYHLVAHLEPNSEAYNTISGMPRTDEMYDIAWRTLVDAYENKRKIVNRIVLSFIDMPSVDTPTRQALIGLINQTNNLLNSLPTYGIHVQHWDPILVPLLLRKLDGESIRLWSLERDQKKIAEIEPLLAFIRKRADGMDSEFTLNVGGSTRTYTSHANASKVSSTTLSKQHFRGADSSTSVPAGMNSGASSKYTHEPSAVKRRRGNCYHCNGAHQLFACESFGRMTIELREERLKTLNICTKCLRRGHSKESCSLSNCKCGGAHNRLLCPQNNNTANLLSMVNVDTVTNIDASLIATLRVNASDKHGNTVKVRAMGDGGAHMCMISKRLFQMLKLDQTSLSIPMRGANNSNVTSKPIVDLKISPTNGSSVGEWLRAGVLDCITVPLPVKQFNDDDWNHIHGLPLADTTFNIPSW